VFPPEVAKWRRSEDAEERAFFGVWLALFLRDRTKLPALSAARGVYFRLSEQTRDELLSRTANTASLELYIRIVCHYSKLHRIDALFGNFSSRLFARKLKDYTLSGFQPAEVLELMRRKHHPLTFALRDGQRVFARNDRPLSYYARFAPLLLPPLFVASHPQFTPEATEDENILRAYRLVSRVGYMRKEGSAWHIAHQNKW